jgi:hypothetical protein
MMRPGAGEPLPTAPAGVPWLSIASLVGAIGLLVVAFSTLRPALALLADRADARAPVMVSGHFAEALLVATAVAVVAAGALLWFGLRRVRGADAALR